MKSEIAGSPVRLHVEFKVDEEFVMPDPGSVFLTIRGTDGALLDGYIQAPQPNPTINSLNLILPADINLLGQDSDFEIRFCRVDFLYENKPQSVEISYRLIPFIAMTANPDSVRAVIGCRYQELPNEDIDLYSAYLSLKSYSGFVVALQSSSVMNLKANRALELREAIRVIPSLQNRLFNKEEKDNAAVTRNKLDLDRLVMDLSAALGLLLDELSVNVGGLVSDAPSIMVVSSPIDPVTGT